MILLDIIITSMGLLCVIVCLVFNITAGVILINAPYDIHICKY